MNYVLQPSLQHIVLAKIGAELWHLNDIRTKIAEFGHPFIYVSYYNKGDAEDLLKMQKWQKIEDKVIENVSVLPLPEPLKKLLINVIRPIGEEIMKWWHYHNVENKNLVLIFPKKLSWTPQGTVDYKETAELLVKDQNLDIERRYKLACIYCLVDEIRALWKRIPEERKNEIYNKMTEESRVRIYNYDNNAGPPDGMFSQDFADYWTHIMRRTELPELNRFVIGRGVEGAFVCDTLDEFAFQCAAFSGSVAASKYCCEILSPFDGNSKNAVLGAHATYVLLNRRFPNSNIDVVLFFLNQMRECDQPRVFKYCVYVLEGLLCWPLQSFFVETARRWWHFMSMNGYMSVLYFLVDKIKRGYKDYNYNVLFCEFWQLGSVNFKQSFLDNDAIWFLLDFFDAKENEMVLFILNEASSFQIQKFIEKLDLTEFLEKWDFIKLLFDEGFISEETLIKFKKKFLLLYPIEQNGKFEKFLRFVDGLVKSKPKRRLDDDAHTAKRHRNNNLQLPCAVKKRRM